MTNDEKAAKYDELVAWLWDTAMGDELFLATVAAAIIRRHEIPGPDGEEPDDA